VRRIDLWGLTHLYVVGGNGGNAAANAINQELQNADVICSVIGVPKSIDNDILLVRFCQTSLHLVTQHAPLLFLFFLCFPSLYCSSFSHSLPMLLAGGSQVAISPLMCQAPKCGPNCMLNAPLLQGNCQPCCCGPLLVTNGLKLHHGICLSGDLSDLKVCSIVTTASSSRRALSPLKSLAPAFQRND